MSVGSALLFIFGVLLLIGGSLLIASGDGWWLGVILLIASAASCSHAEAQPLHTSLFRSFVPNAKQPSTAPRSSHALSLPAVPWQRTGWPAGRHGDEPGAVSQAQWA